MVIPYKEAGLLGATFLIGKGIKMFSYWLYRIREGIYMAYKYELRDTANMSSQDLLNALLAREIAPRVIVGTGYINARQVAIDYLKEEIEKEGRE